jgi:alpha-galactosidase
MLLAYHGCEDVFQPGYDFGKNREWMTPWREVAHCFYGDYFPLTPYSRNDGEWIGWQFNLEEAGEGLVQMFMRPGSVAAAASFRLENLEENAMYVIKDYNTGISSNITGKELTREGLAMTMGKSPDSGLYYYKRIAETGP